MTKQHDIVFIIPEYDSPIGFPLGAATLAAVLQQQGFSIGIVDANATPMDPAECVSRALEMRPGLVGITGLWASVKYLCDVSNQLRERSPSVKQVAGGWWAMTCPPVILDLSSVDCVVRGEADSIITDVCKELLGGNSPDHIAGVYTRNNSDKYSDSDPYLQVRDVCALPGPAYELFDMASYSQPISIYGKLQKNSYYSPGELRELFDGRSEVTLGTSFTGRGCYGQCTFCAAAGQLRRTLPVKTVIDDMALLHERYGIDVFHFDDSLTFSTWRWVEEFCQSLIDRDLKILYRSQMRADFNYRSETLALLRPSGCYEIMTGFESGDSEMLQKMKKGKHVDVALNEKIIRDFRDAGIFVRGSFILNMPGETEQSLQSTIDFAKRTKIVATHGYASPYPGTGLFKDVVRMGYIRDARDLLGMGNNKFTYMNFKGKNAAENFDKYHQYLNYNNLPRSTLLRAERKLRRVLYINKYAHNRKLLYRTYRVFPLLSAAVQKTPKTRRALKKFGLAAIRIASLGSRHAPSGARS